MKETFSILWFDDSTDFFDSLDFEPLESAIRSWGFAPQILTESDQEGFIRHSPFANLDLIVVDYNLGDQVPHGETFIKKIRDNRVLTEVVFYTAGEAKDLWRAISDKELEGVFVANRNGIVPKIIRVARQTIDSVLDLNNMRGIVMAQVADLDNLIESAVAAAWGLLSPPEQEEITTRFREKTLLQVESTRQRIDGFNNQTTIIEILKACDSNKRWENFNRVRKLVNAIKNHKFGNYPQEILKKRNFLAHGQAREEEGTQIFTFEDQEYRFNEEEGVKLRQTILEYKEQLQTTNDALKTALGAI